MCNAIGQSLGSFIGYAVLLLLASETFCNKWLGFFHKSGGIITLKGKPTGNHYGYKAYVVECCKLFVYTGIYQYIMSVCTDVQYIYLVYIK